MTRFIAEHVARDFDWANLPDKFIDDPYPTYAALRKHAPVKRLPDGSVLLTRYADLASVYRDTATYSSDKTVEFASKYGDCPTYDHHTTSLVFNDPPIHKRVRNILQGGLTPRAVSYLEADLVQLVDRLLDEMTELDQVDLIANYAAAIPIEVIGNLLGVPIDEREPLRGWSLAILGALEPNISDDVLKRSNVAVSSFLDYLRVLIDERTRCPGDPETDMLTRLIQGGVDGDKLEPSTLLHNCIFLLNAGHETTTNLIGNGLVLFALHEQERAHLQAEPSLINDAVNEVLRFESSNQLGNRRVVTKTNIGGVDLDKGTLITLCIGAANRDELVFENPDRFDITRRPNRHLAFAGGPHVCLGLGVAQLEGRIALGRFIQRFPNFRLRGRPSRSPRLRFRGFERIATIL